MTCPRCMDKQPSVVSYCLMDEPEIIVPEGKLLEEMTDIEKKN